MRRPMQSLATFPGGMPDTGHSGRANNEEDLQDPYGGGDVEGPYALTPNPFTHTRTTPTARTSPRAQTA
jgi:hypothetical protein